MPNANRIPLSFTSRTERIFLSLAVHAHDSCWSQAWSGATLLDALFDLRALLSGGPLSTRAGRPVTSNDGGD